MGDDENKNDELKFTQQNIYVGGGSNSIQVGHISGGVFAGVEEEHSKRRHSFLFDFYGQALKQAETTFRMSVIFMSIGATIILVGGALAVLRLGAPGPNYAALISSVSGVIIGTCGGAFALHSNRARKHLTSQAEKMERDLRDDRKLEQAMRLVEQIDDPELRDRLKSVTAMRVLNLEPDTSVVTNRLLGEARSERGELE